MFRVFPQDLKPGDSILSDATEGSVLSIRTLEKTVEVNVRLMNGDLRNWIFSKSEMLDLLSSEEQRALYEATIPDEIEATGPTIPVFRAPPKSVFDMDESDTQPFGDKVKTIKAGKPLD